MRADEASAASDADFGSVTGGEGEGFVLGGGHVEDWVERDVELILEIVNCIV